MAHLTIEERKGAWKKQVQVELRRPWRGKRWARWVAAMRLLVIVGAVTCATVVALPTVLILVYCWEDYFRRIIAILEADWYTVLGRSVQIPVMLYRIRVLDILSTGEVVGENGELLRTRLRVEVGDEVEVAGDEVVKRTRDVSGRFVK